MKKTIAGVALMAFAPIASKVPNDPLEKQGPSKTEMFQLKGQAPNLPSTVPTDFDPIGGMQGFAKMISIIGATGTVSSSAAQVYQVDLAAPDSEPQFIDLNLVQDALRSKYTQG